MKHLLAALTILALVSLPLGSNLLAAPHEMSDAEMDSVKGGDAGPVNPAGGVTSSDTTDTTSGSQFASNTIILSGQAQQNLTSMVNILSINSSVQVMLNLNVSINSTVSSVSQGNTGTQSSVHSGQ